MRFKRYKYLLLLLLLLLTVLTMDPYIGPSIYRSMVLTLTFLSLRLFVCALLLLSLLLSLWSYVSGCSFTYLSVPGCNSF